MNQFVKLKGVKVSMILVIALLLITSPYSFTYAEKSNKVIDF